MNLMNDDEIAPLIREKLHGEMVLVGSETEESVIEEYFKTEHENICTDDIPSGFVCIGVYEDYCVVHFAWFDGKYETRRKMVDIGRHIHKKYTIKKGFPIFYQGKKNFYKNHSIQYDNGIWQFVV